MYCMRDTYTRDQIVHLDEKLARDKGEEKGGKTEREEVKSSWRNIMPHKHYKEVLSLKNLHASH